MSDQPEVRICPQCQSSTPQDGKYCLGCGYSFTTGNRGEGPFSFAYPAVQSAYKPDGAGTAKGNLLMLMYGFGAAIVFGPLLSGVNIFIASVSMMLFPLNFTFLAVVVFIIFLAGYMIAPVLTGVLIGSAVERGAQLGKGRNMTTAKRLTAVLSLVCYGAFLGVYFAAMGGQGLASWVDYLQLGWNLIGIPLGAAIAMHSLFKGTPFCEKCREYMKKVELKNRPIRYEKSLIDSLRAGELDKIGEFPPAAGDNNYCKVTIWSCKCDAGSGYIHMETTQQRTVKDSGGKTSENRQTRLVFSGRSENSKLKPLLQGEASRIA